MRSYDVRPGRALALMMLFVSASLGAQTPAQQAPAAAKPQAEKAADALPPARQIIDRYIAAIGGTRRDAGAVVVARYRHDCTALGGHDRNGRCLRRQAEQVARQDDARRTWRRAGRDSTGRSAGRCPR